MKITFLPSNKKVETNGEETLLEIARREHIPIAAQCSGQGLCKKCAVKVLERMKSSVVLACETYPTSDVTVMIGELELEPRKCQLSEHRTLVCDGHLKHDNCYGIAVDLGTTSIVVMLVDMNTGKCMDSVSTENPQTSYGADVIARIQYATTKENQTQLHNIVIEAVNHMIQTLAMRQGIRLEIIYEVVVVGNTTMSHLWLNQSPCGLSKAPFTPSYEGIQTLLAKEIGICIHPTGTIITLPNIKGHVGGDITADLLAIDIKQDGACLLVDIGTNGEIVLIKDQQYYACSTAAGPAFEGATLYQGMRAGEGAIETVVFEQQKVKVSVIGNKQAKGICGSGIIDAIAEMLESGIIHENGYLRSESEAREAGVKEYLCKQLREGETGREFVLCYGKMGQSDVVVTQSDIRSIQLAKGAIMAGIKVLLEEAGLDLMDLKQVLLAGAFGSYLNQENARQIGLLPKVSLEKIHTIGNAAGKGACMALVSIKEREKAIRIAQDTKHIELAGKEQFQVYYLDSMNF